MLGALGCAVFVRPSGAVRGAMEVWISAVVGGLVALAARGWWSALMRVPVVRRSVARACLRAAWRVAGPSLFAAMAEAGASVELRWGSGDRCTGLGGLARLALGSSRVH